MTNDTNTEQLPGSDAGETTKRRATFHTLEVSQVRKLTDKAIEVSFAVPEELQDEYDYQAGQYVALRANIDGQEVRRSYSICEAPTPGTIKVGIKRDLGGLFSNWANDNLAAGGRAVTLYSTAEPCAMCLGAIPWSGVNRVVCGARDADVRAVGFDEGDKPVRWVEKFRRRGIAVTRDVRRAEAVGLLARYAAEGGVQYGPHG